MKVYLRSGDDIYWLVGSDTANEKEWTSALSEKRRINRKQQEVNGAGWVSGKYKDRGGQTVVVEVRTKFFFTDPKACFLFKNSFSDPASYPHPWEGDVYLREEFPDGTYTDAKMPGAVVAITDFDTSTPLTVAISYRIAAGKIVPHTDGEYFHRITTYGSHRVCSDGSIRVRTS